MRKYLLILILIITGIICFSLMFFGLKIGNLTIINSYNDVVSISKEKKQVLSELKQKNTIEFVAKKATLTTAVQEYKNKKSQYDNLVSQGQITNSDLYNPMDLYDVDFLWTTIGNYATDKDVTLQFDVSKSATTAAVSSEYVICDLNFTVTGEYINITDFLYSIENDDKLDFEISDFLIEKGGENLQATFVVKEVPINSKNLSSVPTTSTSIYNDSSIEN